MFVHRTEPIDEFDGLTPLHDYLTEGGPERTRWVLQAVLALDDAKLGWEGDMRHLPLVGHLPTPPGTTPYLLIKQDNNGDTFLISETQLSWLDGHHSTEISSRQIGGWSPTDEDTDHGTEPAF